jgi:hypothetical protein
MLNFGIDFDPFIDSVSMSVRRVDNSTMSGRAGHLLDSHWIGLLGFISTTAQI